MFNFTYYNPVRIVFGKDRLSELNALVPRDARVLVLYGGGSAKKLGVLEKVMSNLGERKIFEFGGIEPNPQYTTLIKALDLVKKEQIDFLLAVGGGSVMDGTKFVALAAAYQGDNPADILTKRDVQKQLKKALPLGTVVTIPATGSEMNSTFVISYNQGKTAVATPLVYPKFSFLDPTLTFTLPAQQVANGVVDIFVHTTEQYLTYPVEGRFQDRTAEGILKTLLEIGRKTIDEPTDYDARANMMWCATIAQNGLLSAGVPQDWTAHMIGHELTAMFGIDHGKTLAVLAPAVWAVLKEQKRAKLLQFAERVWDITEGDEEARIDAAINKTRAFFESLGMKTRLTDLGVGAGSIDALIDALDKHGMKKLSETKSVTLDVSRKILEVAL
ncbi:MAG: iron-containing alcohol dehydrogenase [Pelotomaculum sp.]